MKKSTLLALVALMAPLGTLYAWDLPAEPKAPAITSADFAEVMEAQDTIYLLNVGASQFLNCGNNWGTTASLASTGLKILLQERTETVDGIEVTGIGIQLAGPYTSTDGRNWHDTFLYRDNATTCFVDDSDRHPTTYDIVRVGNYYRIRSAADDPRYGSEINELYDSEFLGWNRESTSTALTANLDPEYENNYCDWALLRLTEADELIAQIDAFKARQTLYETLRRASEVEADATAALALYNNTAATAEELLQANTELEASVNRAYYENLWADASESNPLDVTDDCLTNPSFETRNIDGWLCTFRSGVNADNVGFQSGEDGNGRMGYTNGDVNIHNFIEAWKNAWGDSNLTIGDGELSQTVKGVPAGRYVLSADAIAVHQSDGSKNPVKGVYLFIKAGRFEEKINIATGNEAPQHFEVEFLNEGADEMTFGLRTESCNANWIAADNFRIEYYGKNEQSIERLMLDKLITQYGDNGDDFCNAALYQAYTDALEEAERLVESGTDEECYNYMEVLTAKFQEVQASRQDYLELDKIQEHAQQMAEMVAQNNPQWDDLGDALQALSDDITDKLDNLTADSAYLNQVRGKDMEMIRTYISDGAKVKEGDNLTILLENADFQTTAADKTVVPGWTVTEGSITELSKDWGDIEVYMRKCNLEQVIKNMPMGAYDISVQGFVRGDEKGVELYAGDSKTYFKNIGSEYSDKPSFGTHDEIMALIDQQGHPWPMDSPDENTIEGQYVYRPNSMQGASIYFGQTNPLTQKPFYQNTCRIVLTQAGDLKIGVRVNVDNVWVLWDNFRIAYAGNEPYMYADEIRNRQDAVRSALEAEGAVITARANELAEAAIKAGDDAIKGTSVDDCIAAMKQLDEAQAYAAEGAALSAEMVSVAEFYMGLLETIDSSDDAYREFVLDAWENRSPERFESNEAIKEATQYMKDGWAGYVMYDVKDIATVEDPVDVTNIIYNYDYMDPITMEYSDNGWDITTDGGNHTANEGELECFGNNSFDVSQSLTGLAPGFYILGVNGFYRAGAPNEMTDSLAQVRNAQLYADTEKGSFEEPLMNAMDGAELMAVEVGSESKIVLSDEVERWIPNDMVAAKLYMDLGYYENQKIFEVGEDGKATIGIRKNVSIPSDWTIFTNWTLSYMGTTPPDAIKSIDAARSLKAGNAVYDLAGRRVAQPKRGLYIMGGRKVIVK